MDWLGETALHGDRRLYIGHGLMPWGANVAVVDASVAPEAALL